ncbi:F-box protein skip16 [Phtheirospermum japonicum]|uniref:F-box protein skip16 n=1 Tax=Phtheirospermum japonicum TaxID=374723 RepID=A0A830CN63_9LAMI|nr:F-box protein skip16 [Phtheirospermum japonicum]
MALETVGGLAMHIILSKLGPLQAASVACLSKRFRVWASEDTLWAQFCSDDLDLSSPLDPYGNPTPSFKVLPTLRRGASEHEIDDFENSMKLKLPIPTRILYRFVDGQELPNQHFSGDLPSSLLGIMGGYVLYNHLVNVFLLPLRQVAIDTRGVARQLGLSSRSKYIVVASSATYSEKIFFLDCSSGQLFVGTRNLVMDGEMLPCLRGAKGGEDAMLTWLEEHGRRLHDGVIKVRREGKIRSINLFPEKAPLCSLAVTNGVKVRASAVFVPEFSNLQDESEKFLFGYSIRMSLSPDGCIINGLTFSSCQLHWRHWIIRANDAIVSDINGEAVIGKFPLLRPDEEEFVYESCASLPASKGSIEGSYTFVPGRLVDAKGSPFAVEVARFPLELPDYIF